MGRLCPSLFLFLAEFISQRTKLLFHNKPKLYFPSGYHHALEHCTSQSPLQLAFWTQFRCSSIASALVGLERQTWPL